MIVSLLSDYGYGDEFVGLLHAVILRIHPQARIVDVAHEIRRHDARHGALVLARSLPYLPDGVHVAIVDPQVGTERRAIAVRCGDGPILVGPDNGVLSLAWEGAGGAVEAVDVTRSPHRLEPVSATFHGRDVFAPVAAHLAAGEPLAEAGEPLAVDELERLELPRPRVERGVVVGHAIAIDAFGNAGLNLGHEDMLAAGLTIGTRVVVATPAETIAATVVHTFADVDDSEALVYQDAFGAVAVAINRGDAAATLRLEPDGEVRIARA
jgi:S-adenosyl-L-methionine hydrolase (adenosine-forming)